MRTKLLILTTLWVTLVFLSCGRQACPETEPLWNMEDLGLQLQAPSFLFNSDFNLVEGDTFSRDTIQINIEVAQSYTYGSLEEPFQLDFSPISSARALSCIGPGFNGLEDSITLFTLTANEEIAGIPAGEDLKSLISSPNFYDEQPEGSWESALSRHPGFGNWDILNFYLPGRPDTATAYQFTVEFTFESGKKLEASTVEFIWE